MQGKARAQPDRAQIKGGVVKNGRGCGNGL